MRPSIGPELLQQPQTNNTTWPCNWPTSAGSEAAAQRADRSGQLSLMLQLAPFAAGEEAEDTHHRGGGRFAGPGPGSLGTEAEEPERGRPRGAVLPGPARKLSITKLTEDERRCAAAAGSGEWATMSASSWNWFRRTRGPGAPSAKSCGCCKDAVRTAPGPTKFIDRACRVRACWPIGHEQYQDHVPVSRLVQIYRRGGFETSSSTLCAG